MSEDLHDSDMTPLLDQPLPLAVPRQPTHDDLMRALVGNWRETRAWRKETEVRLKLLEDGQQAMLSEMRKNTEITQQVSDALITARVVRKLGGWFAAIAVSAASLWWAWKEFALGHGPNITPGP